MTIDYDALIPQAQDTARPAVNASEELGKSVAGLADTLFGNLQGAPLNGRHKGRSFLGIRFRVGS